MFKSIPCPHCGKPVQFYANPKPTTDVVIHDPAKGIVIIRRANPPNGYALPGGFVDEGEQIELAAIREMKEETGLDVQLDGLLGVYSCPNRDPRSHTVSTVYAGTALNPEALKAGDDAATAAWYKLDNLPEPIVFDHARIINDFKDVLAGKRCMAPIETLACKDGQN